MITNSTTPRIYVACLASYNNGILHGAWIDCSDADDMRDAIAAMLAKSQQPDAEEWAIHDHEGFLGIHISGSHDLDELAELAELAELIEDTDEDLLQAAIKVADSSSPDDLREALDRFCGSYDSLADWAEELCSDLYDLSALPSFITAHIDWEYVAKNELIMGGDYCHARVNHQEYLFRSN